MSGAVIAYPGPTPNLSCRGPVAPEGWTMRLKPIIAAALSVAACLCAPLAAAAEVPLSENSYVTDRLVAARVADRIRKTCPTIGARLFRAFLMADALKDWAYDQGYAHDEVKAFLKDKTEKQKLYARAEGYLAQNGATPDNVDGFCALGRKEIADETIAGSLLYER